MSEGVGETHADFKGVDGGIIHIHIHACATGHIRLVHESFNPNQRNTFYNQLNSTGIYKNDSIRIL